MEFIEQIFNGLLLGCNYTLIAMGFSFFFGALNVVHFSHGDVCILGSFIILVFYQIGRALGVFDAVPGVITIPVVIAAATILTGILGAVFEKLAIKPFRQSPLLMVLVATVALGLIIRESLRLFYPQGSNPQIFPALLPDGAFSLGGLFFRYDSLIILGLTIVLITLVFLFVERTRMGTAIRAISQDTEAAVMMGVNVDTTVSVTFILGSALGALAGILNGVYIGIIRFDMGLMGGIKGFSAAVVGGLGNIYGAIFGGILLGFVETFASVLIPGGTAYKDVFSFLVVIFFLVFKPSGILGERVYEKV
ncbi:MAG: branched-chain amino acid ABC transporter permease [Deltaproteobacteria bacterium]|nr:branched-chain amino acid ABC transporter permease [Deltaproteobacteria bacterium]